MPSPPTDLLEMILRECAAAAPAPWYPSSYAQETGIPRQPLDSSLDELRLAGLIRLTDWVQGKGQGYAVTPAGEEVLKNQRLLAGLRTGAVPAARQPAPPEQGPGERPAGWERTAAIKEALTAPGMPVVTFALIAANALVFLGGLLLAYQQNQGVVQEYLHPALMTQPRDGDAANVERANYIRLATGALLLGDVVEDGHWWKLLGCCFVHFGVLHLGMNMFFLYSVGRLVERMWGAARYLVLYLISGLASSCASLLFSPGGLYAGASGALCGLLLSMGVWVYLNRPYLPTSLASSWMRSVGTNVLLIVFISLMPGISAAGHGGGAVAGALVSVPLVYTRFGRGSQRWLGWLGTLVLAVIPLALVLTNRRVEVAEVRSAVREAKSALEKCGEATSRVSREALTGARVSPEKAQEVLAQVAAARAKLEAVDHSVALNRPYWHADVREALPLVRDYLGAWHKYLDQFDHCLDSQGTWKCGQGDTLEPHVAEINAATRKLWDSVLVAAERR